jgi:hypothetical protein
VREPAVRLKALRFAKSDAPNQRVE